MTRTRASNAKLEPGEHTAGSATPRKQQDGSYWVDFSVRLPDGRMVKPRPRAKGQTIGIARRRAKKMAADILANAGLGEWKPSSDLVSYIEQFTVDALARADLADRSRARYDGALKLILDGCDDPEHVHRHSLRNVTPRHTIGTGIRYRPIQALLTEIAKTHQYETARQCRTVLTKYCIKQLVLDEIVQGNPIANVTLTELIGVKKPERSRGGRALTTKEYTAVLAWLLEQDPAKGMSKRQGRYPLSTLVAKPTNAILQCLVQLATGLRSEEVNKVRLSHCTLGDDGVMRILATVTKGDKPRQVLVLVPEVAERILQRQAKARERNPEGWQDEFPIGSPNDPMKAWDYSARNKAAAVLYKKIGTELEVEMFADGERSHSWRTTNHMRFKGQVDDAVLNGQFGNSAAVRAGHYFDHSDLSELARAAGVTNGDEEQIDQQE